MRDGERQRVAERLVADTVAAVLGRTGVDSIIRDRTFRDLGLDSLLTVPLCDRLTAATGLPVTAKTLFDHPTCARLARHLAAANSGITLPAQRPQPSGSTLRPERAAEPKPAAMQAPTSQAASPEPSHPASAESSPRTSTEPTTNASHSPGLPHEVEPIAVVGLACRFPGADSVQAFWRLLEDGADAVRPVPQDRWPTADPTDPLPSPVERAGLLRDGNDSFDALFFGISPREAKEMDPQQRLFLEVAWEALEDAGLANGRLEGSRTGVFAGATWHDFADVNPLPAGPVTPYTATGRALNMIPNRLSYVLGLRGPSMVVDTACSSSLLAVHLACRSIADRECDTAIVGGVNLLLSRDTSVALKEFGGLSPDGRCKTFDIRADGYGRGEGCGVVILKSLSRALADGDEIWCTIRGSATNNDGASNGLTAPSPTAQEDVLRDAYRRAGVSPAAVGVVEAHGTGTALGDEIEATVLGTVIGAGRPREAPLLLGSVKTNIGHLEAAAGVAGLIKTALALKYRKVPRSLHFQTPNPGINIAALRLRIPTETEPWPASGPALAGVSSFSWGGTNVHVVLEGWEEPTDPRPAPTSATPRHRYRLHLRSRREPLGRHGTPAAAHRTRVPCGSGALRPGVHPPHRTVVAACPLPRRGSRPGRGVRGSVRPRRMAGVSRRDPGRRRRLWSGGDHRWCRSGCARPTGRGTTRARVHPARAAPAVTRLRPRCDRSGGGRPARHARRGTGGRIRLEAMYGARTTVVAGPTEELRALVATWTGRGVGCAILPGGGSLRDSAVAGESLIAAVGQISPSAGRIPWYSSVTGGVLDWSTAGAGYFARVLGEPARLADAVDNLLATGPVRFLEIGVDPLLTPALRESADESGTERRSCPRCPGTMPRAWGPSPRWRGLRPSPNAREPDESALVTLAARTPRTLRELAGRMAATVRPKGSPAARTRWRPHSPGGPTTLTARPS